MRKAGVFELEKAQGNHLTSYQKVENRQKGSRGLNEGEERGLISDGNNIWWDIVENRIRFHQLYMSLEKGSYGDPKVNFLRTWTSQLKSMCGQYSERD